jgi:hypothetical protein
LAFEIGLWVFNGIGRKVIIPTTLTFGILGYPFILPDMIGGNGYGEVLQKDVILPNSYFAGIKFKRIYSIFCLHFVKSGIVPRGRILIGCVDNSSNTLPPFN